MNNNSKATIAILVAMAALISLFMSLPYLPVEYALIWFGVSAIVLLVAAVALVVLHRQAKSQASACTMLVQATVKWHESGSGSERGGLTMLLVLDILVGGILVEKGYVQRGELGAAELSQFLAAHPVGAKLPIKINQHDLSTIVLAENNVEMSDHGESLIKQRMASRQ